MDFIRRAWLFTKAKIGRTILLIVAFSAILIFVLSGLIINSAANVSIDNAKKSAGATVSLSVNMQNVIIYYFHVVIFRLCNNFLVDG